MNPNDDKSIYIIFAILICCSLIGYVIFKAIKGEIGFITGGVSGGALATLIIIKTFH